MFENLSLLITERLKEYKGTTDGQVINAAKEIVQEIALLGLSRSGFFKKAAFHGGTALRIFYGVDRFSEDLDFCLLEKDLDFSFASLLDPLKDELNSWGLAVEITDRSKVNNVVKKMFLKEGSLGAMLELRHPLPRGQKFAVKIELDTNPPAGATHESKLCEFPTDFYVVCHDMQSMFAGKIHALLRRSYPKGRDWYDFAYYISKKAEVNFTVLRNALLQSSVNDKSSIPDTLGYDWLKEELKSKILESDFEYLRKDINPFVIDDSKVQLLSKEYFLDKLDKLII
jgi:predicted nucleotidyltransferase component of viral defense system